jgi:hypothetical protein
MPMLALVVAAMALGFGAAAAWKHHLFDRLLPARETSAARSAQEPSTNRRAIPSEARSEPSSTAQPSAVPEDDSFLSVSCHPACVVWIGKRELGISPVVKAPVPPGRHRVVVYRDGVGSKVLLVHIDRGEHASYDVTMSEPAPEPEASAAPTASGAVSDPPEP